MAARCCTPSPAAAHWNNAVTTYQPAVKAPTPLWIDNDDALAQHCVNWRQRDAIAIDSEFIRRDTYYPAPALLQVCDGDAVVLIDPLAISDWQPFAALMADAGCIKILHSASEDIEVFLRLGCVQFAALFDTQIAAPLCGLDAGMGYQRLVLALLGVELDKAATQTNWLQRPLTTQQMHYAVDDVWFLLLVYRQLVPRLDALQRTAWAIEEAQSRLIDIATQVDPELCYHRIERGWQLKPAQQQRLQRLCAWRERAARELDRPRKWLLPDHSMMDMAQQVPHSAAELASIDGIDAASLRRHGADWLQLLAEKVDSDDELWLQPLSRDDRDRLSQLRHAVDRFCNEQQLPASLMLRKDEAVTVIRTAQAGAWQWLDTMPQWRRTLLQPIIAQWLAQDAQTQELSHER
jgi:ribonuclease D